MTNIVLLTVVEQDFMPPWVSCQISLPPSLPSEFTSISYQVEKLDYMKGTFIITGEIPSSYDSQLIISSCQQITEKTLEKEAVCLFN